MGEKKENIKAKDEGIATILLKLDLHCEGCAKKVKRSVRHFEGVEEVKADYSTGKLMVKGNVDPLWLRERVEIKTKKEVQLISDQPKKGSGGGGGGGDSRGGGDTKSDEKVEKKAEEKMPEDEKPKKAQFNTEVTKVRLHCDSGPALKVKRFIKELTPYLKDKLNRTVDVPPKKDDGSGGDYNKKEKELASGGKKKDGGGDNRKKEKEASIGGGGSKKKDGESPVAPSKSTEPKERKAEVMNKMEYDGYNNPNTYYAMPPRYNQNYYNQDYGVAMHNHGYGHTGYVPPQHDHGYGHTGYVPPPHDHGYGHRGYVPPPHDHGYGHTGYVPPPYSAPQFFSDENPNACSVM
ncbi:heavy metal-associated isoprenylated plant protein 6-like isoform X1 [Lycium ferocissimum]|uniref:heavy metal-associated isoprenylated plant protein 6-like isoform X1 n=2 Tax=Lycium ferocissimum TaxID=112874 RepID=UPI0028153B94|nr:heavy metal-associated isoprenylated plant protein 6-like isoform X1 [Lycium ferocissimum]